MSRTISIGGSLNRDRLVQACLNQGAYCVIDLHNYGRFDDYLIGQGGSTDAAFVALWAALAAKYAKEPYVIFGLMNQISSGDSYVVNSTKAIYSVSVQSNFQQAMVNKLQSHGTSTPGRQLCSLL